MASFWKHYYKLNIMAQKNSKSTTDIQDSKRDQQHLTPDEATIDLPDVEDIPGQENIRVPKMKEMIDATISSADEEGENLFDEDELDSDTDVTKEEKDLLRRSSESMAGEDDEAIRNSMVDRIDEDGEKLNEDVDVSGSDLDVPGSELDDADEETGNEDEENNSYSLGQ